MKLKFALYLSLNFHNLLTKAYDLQKYVEKFPSLKEDKIKSHLSKMEHVDLNKNEKISVEELKESINDPQIFENMLDMFLSEDLDGDGEVSFEEMFQAQVELEEEHEAMTKGGSCPFGDGEDYEDDGDDDDEEEGENDEIDFDYEDENEWNSKDEL